MGFAGISMPQLLIILGIVVLVFGTKRIRQAGGDIGAMIAGFRKEAAGADLLETAKDVRKAKKLAKAAEKVLTK